MGVSEGGEQPHSDAGCDQGITVRGGVDGLCQQVTTVLAVGGDGGGSMTDGATPGISHATAILLAIGYSLIALSITATVLTRRDRP